MLVKNTLHIFCTAMQMVWAIMFALFLLLHLILLLPLPRPTHVAGAAPDEGSSPADPSYNPALSIKEREQTAPACSSALYEGAVNGL